MGLFRKKKNDLPKIDLDQYEPVLRCSICSGEQVLCLKDRQTGALHELMLIISESELEDVCEANGIDRGSIAKVY